MKKIDISDIKNIYEYEKIRKEFRDKIIQIKKVRRLPVGPMITLVFENRDTVIFQIQEMMRAERMVDDKIIQGEIDIYNELIPEQNQIKATMMIEITQKDQIKPILDSLVGLNRESVFLIIDNKKIEPIFDSGQFEDDKISAVQYLTFNLDNDAIKEFSDFDKKAEIEINHINYKAKVELPKELRMQLLEELKN